MKPEELRDELSHRAFMAKWDSGTQSADELRAAFVGFRYALELARLHCETWSCATQRHDSISLPVLELLEETAKATEELTNLTRIESND
jgi:hypothetical protein